MSSDKHSLPLYEKSPLSDCKEKRKLCSRYVISWILGTLLVLLVFVLAVEFLYPVVEEKFHSDVEHFTIFDQRPIEVKVIPPTSDVSKNTSKGKKEDGAFWNIDFTINPVDLCSKRNPAESKEELQEDSNIKLFVAVPSETDHFSQRSALRNAWCSITQTKPQDSLRLAFILSQASNKTEQELIRHESANYDDIIQVNYLDTEHKFSGSTVFKYVMAWMTKHCPQAQYFYKANDDKFLNSDAIARLLDGEPFASKDHIFGGFGFGPVIPPLKKPNEDRYELYGDYSEVEPPPFAFGAGFINKGPVLTGLFQGSHNGQSGEKSLVTGIIAQDIELAIIPDPKLLGQNAQNKNIWKDYGSGFPMNQMAPGFNVESLQRMMDEMTKSLIVSILKQEEKPSSTITPLPLPQI